MLCPVTVGIFNNGNDIKTDGQIHVKFTGIHIRSAYNSFFFGGIHRFQRRNQVIIRAGLHLYHHQLFPVGGNNIQLLMPVPPVTVQNTVTFIFEVLPGECLTLFTCYIMCCHMNNLYKCNHFLFYLPIRHYICNI